MNTVSSTSQLADLSKTPVKCQLRLLKTEPNSRKYNREMIQLVIFISFILE